MLAAAALPLVALGSSHREAPNIMRLPTVDSTDFYMFMSYEPGREGYVTLLANYVPLRDSYGNQQAVAVPLRTSARFPRRIPRCSTSASRTR